ncbi:hypothetical protein ABQW72_00405 [Xanthomonas hortorum pv. pelargonii]|uniref:hypothetical protein n=1 Tax=Xanthomonas hortorum TaxID=56454 RepID=UPI0021C67D62|nr:hypothetical protein [Xanthomonas hortorum]MCU1709517.1 hypothetical protein [Xanthomonas hortorum pv. pelargonii]WCI07307.1 hypothetical protein PML25_22175 [Xanthomonas hortorum pv. pelargonii]WOB32958.1 hypothetical protein NYR98_22530 [Xanthomonas hortorum pv. pelargonii]
MNSLVALVSSRNGGIDIVLFNKERERTVSVTHGTGLTVTDALCDALAQHTAFFIDEDVELALCVAALRNSEVQLSIRNGTIHAH